MIRVALALALAATIVGCEKKTKISESYDKEISALDTEGGTGLPYLAGRDMRPVWNLDSPDSPAARKLLPFNLKNQLGKTVNEAALAGKVTIVSFFFSKCPGTCPMTTKNLRTVQSRFKDDDRVRIVSLSVTPESDTPKVLKEYAKSNRIDERRWQLLTGTKKAIYDLARESFDADTYSARENAREKLGEKDFLHSENVYLLDGELKLRGIYAGVREDSVRELADDAETLLK